jgi:uncharacterized protein (DUF1330 family)
MIMWKFCADIRHFSSTLTGREGRGWEHGGVVAYVISEVEVVDEESGQKYRELASASIDAYGGRYIVRGAEPDVPEGDWPSAQRVVVVEFPTMELLQRWYASPEYAEALTVRRTALRRRLLFVAGVELRPAERQLFRRHGVDPELHPQEVRPTDEREDGQQEQGGTAHPPTLVQGGPYPSAGKRAG